MQMSTDEVISEMKKIKAETQNQIAKLQQQGRGSDGQASALVRRKEALHIAIANMERKV